MPLSMADVGEKKCVIKVNGKDRQRKHLEKLGFVEGTEVTVVSEISGNMIVNVKDSRIAIDKSLANRIIV
ncbi:MAG: FeoA family protein [Clostridiales bacterium]|nr:FeoA family protein [Clostridiales bacterium]